jgi:signal transduction histidine kinase
MKNDKVIYLLVLQFIIIIGFLIIDPHDPTQKRLNWFLFVTILVITSALLWIRLLYHAQLKSMNIDLQRIIDGNVNTRLLVNHEKTLNEFVFSVNELIEQLDKVQAMSIKSQAARKRILSSISHDIRTPLTSIIGYVDALKDNIAASEDEKRYYLEIIARKSYSLKQLLDKLFELAKIDANEITLQVELLDFAEIVRESLIEFLPLLKNEGMELKASIPEEKCFLMADRISLMRIIGNLIMNAVRYGKEGRVLGIELTETVSDYHLQIWDHGPGISNADIENVFERMYRGDQSRKNLYESSGLGLPIAKALVEKNHGRIWIESIPWKITKVGFSIPKYNPKPFKKQLRTN